MWCYDLKDFYVNMKALHDQSWNASEAISVLSVEKGSRTPGEPAKPQIPPYPQNILASQKEEAKESDLKVAASVSKEEAKKSELKVAGSVSQEFSDCASF